MRLLRLMHEVNLFDSLLNRPAQIFHINRFRGKVEGTIIHGLANVLHVTVGTHHDDAQCSVAHLVHLGQQRQAVHFRHIDVAKDNLNIWVVIQDSKGLQSVVGKEELILPTANLAAEVLFHQQLQRSLVINTQNLYCSHNI